MTIELPKHKRNEAIASLQRFLAKGLSSALQRRARIVPRPELLISSVTEAEMRHGLELLPPEARLHVTIPRFLDSIEAAPWDSLCAKHYGHIAASQRRNGKTLSTLDTMIAAHALALGLTLITNDQAFTRIPGLAVEDWTQGPHPA